MLKKAVLLTLLAIQAFGCAALAHAADLSPKQQSITAISALTAQGDLDRLRPAIARGLDNGMTVNEIKEVLVHLYAYTGFPRSLNGLNTLLAVVKDRSAAGIQDTIGRDASPAAADRDRHAIGTSIQTELVGRPVTGEIYEFAPIIDTFLKEHLFCDIFERDVLTYQERELATVSALAGLKNVNPQLRSHLNASLYNGIDQEQLTEWADVLEQTTDSSTADNARDVLAMVLKK